MKIIESKVDVMMMQRKTGNRKSHNIGGPSM
jgi:hypothetical protein